MSATAEATLTRTVTRTCEVCGDPIQSRRVDATVCSPKCRAKRARQKTALPAPFVTCQHCGCEFQPNRADARFHSDACRKAWHKQHDRIAATRGLAAEAVTLMQDIAIATGLRRALWAGGTVTRTDDIEALTAELDGLYARKRELRMEVERLLARRGLVREYRGSTSSATRQWRSR